MTTYSTYSRFEWTRLDVYQHAERLAVIMKRCAEIDDLASGHISQFSSSKLNLQSDYEKLITEFLFNFGNINEEVSANDKFSITDMLFTTLCYINVAQNPAWRMNTLQYEHIPVVIDVLRLCGSQHTPDTFNTPPSHEVLKLLEQCISQIVVYVLSSPVEAARADLNQQIPLSKRHAMALVPPCFKEQHPMVLNEIEKIKTYVEAPKTTEGKFLREVEFGDFWRESNKAGCFVIQSSRVLHALLLEHRLMQMYPVIPSSALEPIHPELIHQFNQLVIERSAVDTSDDFSSDFKSFVVETMLPVNSRLHARTRSSGGAGGCMSFGASDGSGGGGSSNAEVIPLTLVQHELGFDVGTKISDDFGVKVRSIASQPDHPYYDLYQIFMFGYICFHEQHIDFVKIYVINHGEIFRELKQIMTLQKFGFRREPLILRLQRKFYVHYIADNPDSEGGEQGEDESDEHYVCRKYQGRMIECSTSTEAVLRWLMLLKTYTKSELIAGHNLTKFTDRFLIARLSTRNLVATVTKQQCEKPHELDVESDSES